MLFDFEIKEIEEIWEKMYHLNELHSNIDCVISDLNNILLKMIPHNRLINVGDIIIRVDTNKHSIVMNDVRAQKSYYLNDLEPSDNDDLLAIIVSAIDWYEVISDINDLIEEELDFKNSDYNIICDLVDSLRKQEISNDEEDGKDYADDRCEIKII